MTTVLLIALAVLLAGFLAFVASRPSDFRVARSIVIDAPPSAAFAQIEDLRRWPAWSPFEKLDPAMRRRYEGANEGVGAIYDWTGNQQAGEGRATIVDSRADERVRIRLDFRKPFRASNLAEFQFEPLGEQTRITWTMSGRNNFMFKAVGVFMSMDKMVGGMFEQGLKELKSVAERSPR